MQAFESGQIPTTLWLASVWLIGVCAVTMIYAAANGLHLPPAFGWLGAPPPNFFSFRDQREHFSEPSGKPAHTLTISSSRFYRVP